MAAVHQDIEALLSQSVQEGLLDDQFLQLIQLQVWAGALSSSKGSAPAAPPTHSSRHRHPPLATVSPALPIARPAGRQQPRLCL